MTREEAIKQLEFMLEQMPEEPPTECDCIDEWLDTDKDVRDALEMAIKALEQEPILDKMRDEVINRYPKNYAGEPELNGNACEFSLNQILQIIDKHKAESEV